jgi:3-methyl-2-oxobutanoate hydroxymethyltransferase
MDVTDKRSRYSPDSATREEDHLMKKTLAYLKDKKLNNQKISALTSYDYPMTLILEQAGVDMIILGDSVGTNILGYDNETQVTLDDMIHHTKAVCRAKKDIFLVVDLPYKTYETPDDAVKNARKLVKVGADAVKFEGIKKDILVALKGDGINVMCHIGLNPQHDQEKMRQGRIAKGKLFDEAIELLEGAQLLERHGADLIILEKIPERISRIITQNLKMPTVGIGAGKYCDGQVLIVYDLLGINERKFKHNPEYINLRQVMIDTVKRYRQEVESGVFPDKKHINIIHDDEYEKIRNWCLNSNYTV